MHFNNLNEIYSFLESNVYNVKRNWDLARTIKNLVDITDDESLKEKLNWECYVFDFDLQDGNIVPLSSTTKEDGTTISSYPSYEHFGDSGMNYLKSRAKEVNSSYLIVRYNQILWNSSKPYKHHQQAKNAIDAYLSILANLNCIKEEKRDGWDCLELIKNALRISFQIKYKIDSLKAILQSWLFDKGIFPTKVKVYVLKYMLEFAAFKKEDFNGSLEIIRKFGISLKKKEADFFLLKEAYEIGLRIAQRTNTHINIWNKRIGDSMIRMADARMNDESRIIPLSFLKEAIPYYKLAGLDKKVSEIEQRYFELKKELKLTKYELPLNDEIATNLNEVLKAKINSLLEQSPEEIFSYLISAKDLFPQEKSLKEIVKNSGNSFMDYAVVMQFDINNNISRQDDTKEAKDKAKLYQNYKLYMRIWVSPFLHRIFVGGIKQGKVTYENLINFFIKHTWLGQEFTDYESGGELVRYRWVSVIGPAIYEYFKQTESALRSSNSFTNYIMPIDSLTLKFEGVLRDFAKILKISTTVTGKRNVLREKYIEEILADPGIQKFFDENDRLFFNYLFVAKDGMNLRNNIAHSFYRFNDYNFQIMHLLICAFLRIGKYKMVVIKQK